MDRKPMIEVCGLWKNKNGKGLSGASGGVRYWVFPNEKKGGNERAPDYRLVLSENETREGGGYSKGREPGSDDGGGF